MRVFAPVLPVFLLAALLCVPSALAWTPASQKLLGEHALQVAPKDFRTQIAKYRKQFEEGLLAPFRTAGAEFHQRAVDSGRLDEALAQEVKRTIAMLEGHRPFEEIAYQAGVVVHYVNDLNNPLGCSDADPSEPKYYADYLRYLESTEPRLRYLFYGLSPTLEGGSIDEFINERLERCRENYRLIGQEYRRIGKLPGTRYFDDRSTAFGISGVAHSRAITDGALVLRHIWISAGGRDWREAPQESEGRYFEITTAATGR